MMKKTVMITVMILVFFLNSNSQIYLTRTGYIGFFSTTPLENVRATNNQVYSIVDVAKKNVAFTLLFKGFTFEKELMQEHFNENYIESDKYPKATFNGSYEGDVSVNKDGVYPIVVTGELTMHGVTKKIQEKATLEVKNEKLLGTSNFYLRPEDFNIKIPSLVREKIADRITVNVQINCSIVK